MDTFLVSVRNPPSQRFIYLILCPKVLDFLDDFSNASSRAKQLDSRIFQEAVPISGNLGDLVALATT